MNEGELFRRINKEYGIWEKCAKIMLNEAKADLINRYAEANKTFGTTYEEEVKIYEKWVQYWFGDTDDCTTCAMGIDCVCVPAGEDYATNANQQTKMI